jgi:hypothetical protein
MVLFHEVQLLSVRDHVDVSAGNSPLFFHSGLDYILLVSDGLVTGMVIQNAWLSLTM